MGLTGKLLIPLFGVVLLCGVVFGSDLNYDDINALPTDEKRRIIRELLRAQRDIRSALLKIHYSLNGEEFDADGKEEPYWQGCWDKDLAGYRNSIETKISALTSGIKQAHHLMDEVNERVKPHRYGPYKPGGGSYGEYGPPGYGPPEYGPPEYGPSEYGPPSYGPDYEGGYRPDKPSHPPTTSYRPPTESYGSGGGDDDDYYGRSRPAGGNRRYGRELDLSKQAEVNDDKPVDPIEESAVVDALDQRPDEKQ